MIQLLDLICYGLVLLFGIAVSVCFLGIEYSKKNMVSIGCFFLLTLYLQICSWLFLGIEQTKQLYPLIVHLMLVLFLRIILKRSWLASLSSVFAAYLCCQIPKWFGSIDEMIFQTQFGYYLSYIPAMALCYFFLRKYVAVPVSRIIAQSKKSCLMFGTIPFLYYVFDYVSTIYTDWLYSGSTVAVHFIPSVVSMFYFVFVLLYYAETQKEKSAQQERDQMAAQLRQAKIEFDTLRQMQEQTRQYRHDMRHHFLLLQGLAAKGDVKKIVHYLKTAESDLEAFTPTQYCENETVNLLLSSFETLAKQTGVVLSAEACIPEILSISDTEICSLLSNSLENAITAAAAVPIPEKRIVSVKITVYKGKLLLSVKNPYEGKVILHDGLPQTIQKGHGYGTHNISAIAEFHGGQALFSTDSNMFSLKVMIPL